MEPIAVTIVTALVAGARTGIRNVATDAIKESYEALRRLLYDRYENVRHSVDDVISDPASEPERQVLAKKLQEAGAGNDQELKGLAQQLLEAVKSEPRAAPLFDIDKLRAAGNFELEDIQAVGTVLRAGEATIEGDFKATGIRQEDFSKKK